MLQNKNIIYNNKKGADQQIKGYNNKNQSEEDFIHKYDDVVVPHLENGKRTWYKIDTVEQARLVDAGQSLNAERVPKSEVRYLLYQDQINFVKYFTNKELIPIYEYFDGFFDSFCKIALSLIISGENSSDENSNPEFLNMKSLILLNKPLPDDEVFEDKEPEQYKITIYK